MTKAEVLELLEENKNDRGIANWQKLGPKAKKMKSYGLGLTQLRKLAKKIGRDHKLAQQLWKSNVYDAKVLGLLIDDPKVITKAQAETQVDQLQAGMLSHVFASCDATLAKAPFAPELAVQWADSKDDMRRRCGYLLLYELSKSKKKGGISDDQYSEYIDRIQESIHDEENWVRDAMTVSLMGIGKRNKKLNKEAIKAAKVIGVVEVDYGDNGCKPLDVHKHLTSPYIKEKLGT